MRNTPSIPPIPEGRIITSAEWDSLLAAGVQESELLERQPFGPAVSVVTRKQLIEDGTLIDLCQPGLRRVIKDAGIKVHCAMTATCFAEAVYSPASEILRDGQVDMELFMQGVIRLQSIVRTFTRKVLESEGGSTTVHFEVMGCDGRPVAMYVLAGPGDAGEMVFTFMLEGED